MDREARLADVAMFLEGCAALPLEAYQPGDVILRKGEPAGKVFILKEGAVEVVDGEERIALASEPGAVFGELGVLLDQPPMADVRVLKPSTFYVAAGKVFLRVHRDAALHVAGILARRLVSAHRNLDKLRGRLTPEQRDGMLAEMVDAVDRSLIAPPG
jgi:CRP/FNR family transcriptional regulator, cyclic AMP receptor protein